MHLARVHCSRADEHGPLRQIHLVLAQLLLLDCRPWRAFVCCCLTRGHGGHGPLPAQASAVPNPAAHTALHRPAGCCGTRWGSRRLARSAAQQGAQKGTKAPARALPVFAARPQARPRLGWILEHATAGEFRPKLHCCSITRCHQPRRQRPCSRRRASCAPSRASCA